MQCYSGKSVYPGVAFGTAFVLRQEDIVIDESPAADPGAEWSRFEEAKRLADTELELLFNRTLEEVGEAEAGIIDVQRMILEDEDFIEAVRGHIMDEVHRAAHAVSKAGRFFLKCSRL